MNVITLSIIHFDDCHSILVSCQVCAALAALDALPGMLALHHQRGVTEAISRATAADLALWMTVHRHHHGNWGLSETGWLRHHLSGRLFRLGRLQFMLTHCPDLKNGRRPTDPVQCGEPVLDVHIPAGEPLARTACLASFSQAAAFFADQSWRGFYCASWLLAPRLPEVLPAVSNIRDFQQLFVPIPRFSFVLFFCIYLLLFFC